MLEQTIKDFGQGVGFGTAAKVAQLTIIQY
jgi:hypothetical protein